MLDPKLLERDAEEVAKNLSRRGQVVGLNELLELFKRRKALIFELQKHQEERNSQSKLLGKASKEQIDAVREAMRSLGQAIREKELLLKEVEAKIEDLALRVPNIPRADVPDGKDADDNVEIKRVLTPRKFDFQPRDHVELGELTDTIDLERAAKISGARFGFFKGQASRLNRALIQMMTDYHVSKGDTELTPPYLVKASALVGTGSLPKFKEDLFEVPRHDTEPLYLIPTAEVPVTNYYADEILEEHKLPARFCAHSACFRSEAGSAGRDTRGMIRVHQFEKVEMVRFCIPEQANVELEDIVSRASELLSLLELPHRIVTLCAGDMGFQPEKTIDVEVWLPSQNTYREISSCSAYGTFQARRANIRYRAVSKAQGGKAPVEYVATLNGSGLPMGRTLVAIYENYQQADGSIRVPKVLQPYMNGLSVIPVYPSPASGGGRF